MKHKHAELIKAWADGACVQGKDVFGQWVEIADIWTGNEYRIKPEEKKPVVRWLWAYKYCGRWLQTTDFFESEIAIKQDYPNAEYKRLDWSRTEFEE